MSVRFLPAVLLPSGDKVVSTLAAACQWVVKVSEGFQNTHTALLLSCNLTFTLSVFSSLDGLVQYNVLWPCDAVKSHVFWNTMHWRAFYTVFFR